MRIETKELDNILSKVAKAAPYDKALPLTCIITLKANNDVLTMYTTNLVTTMFGFVKCLDTDSFSISVDVNTLAKLIHSISTDTVSLEVKKNVLYISGNGNYRLNAINNGRGEAISLPDPRDSYNSTINIIDVSTIKTAVKALSLSIAANDFAIPCYKDVYFGEKIMTSDTSKLSALDAYICYPGKLISYKLLSLLSLFDEDITIKQQNNLMLAFESSNLLVVSSVDDIQAVPDYQADALLTLLYKSYEYTVKINKREFLEALNRFSILSQDKVSLDFSSDLTIQSKDGNFSEKIVTGVSINKALVIDYLILKQYVNTFYDDVFEFNFDENSSFIMLKDSELTHIVSI